MADQSLIEAIQLNIASVAEHVSNNCMVAAPYVWGNTVEPLLQLLEDSDAPHPGTELKFDYILLADLLFNRYAFNLLDNIHSSMLLHHMYPYVHIHMYVYRQANTMCSLYTVLLHDVLHEHAHSFNVDTTFHVSRSSSRSSQATRTLHTTINAHTQCTYTESLQHTHIIHTDRSTGSCCSHAKTRSHKPGLCTLHGGIMILIKHSLI
jgi:hypothetical protein